MGAFAGAVSGYDAGYYAAQATAGGGQRTAGSYYVREAPGIWRGAGLEALGLADGQVVEIERDDLGNVIESGAFFDIYARQLDPQTGEVLGRRPDRRDAAGKPATAAAERLEQLLAAEPHADAKRIRQLSAQASRAVRPSPRYADVTVGFSKSISILHASIRVNAEAAERAGDTAAAAYWASREAAFQDVLQAANAAAMRHAEQWAQTRTGYHGRKVEGRELGKFAKAQPVISSWLQGTSREGDPHDHVHNLWWRMSRTAEDGHWRALDTMALRHQLPAIAAVAAAHAEAGLTREFGVEWVARPDGAGNEIRGITQAQMSEFSSRRAVIDRRTAELTDQFRTEYKRDPTRAELKHMRDDAKRMTRAGKDDAPIDWAQKAREWDARLEGELAPVAARVSAMRAPGAREAHAQDGAQAQGAREWEPTRAEAQRTVQMALSAVQAAHASWTRADLTREVERCMPAESRALDPDCLVALIHDLTDEALRGKYQTVVCLEAPEWPTVPDTLRHEADGRSVYTRAGTARYATEVQLRMEERLVRAAQREGAPCLTREAAAQALGADADALDAALRDRAQDARESGAPTATGLRLDQGAAAYHLLTSPRTLEVLVGPAGSGKTHTLAEVARAWKASGRDVVGVATSQMGANALREAGIERTYNTAQFLGHTKTERGARGPVPLEPETLIILDEASMTSTPDACDIAEMAVRGGHKGVASGDHAQLQAVESGGAMGLMVAELGHVKLAEAVRFSQEWEQGASLDLRAGRTAALEAYQDHGRLRGGTPDEVKAGMRRLYVAHYLAGTDVELIVWQRELGRELADAVRDDLRHLGVVDTAGPEVGLAEGARAGVGDIIRTKQVDHALQLANNDVLRVEAVNDDGSLTVRRSAGRDRDSGRRLWAEDTIRYRDYATAELAYTSTAHAKQGATVTIGLPVVTGGESAEWLYSALTRGAEANIVGVYTEPARRADPDPRDRAAPELAQHERMQAERAGVEWPEAEPDSDTEPREPVAVLADILERSGAELSALELQRRNLAQADHLAVLHAQWQGEAADMSRARYRQMIAAHLPAGVSADALDTAQATWLYRTLRQAEAAGLDAGEVIARAIADRSLLGARDVPSVIDARIRRENGPMLPGAWRPWSDRVLQSGDPERDRYLRELAEAMDGRRERIGEDAAEHERPWAVAALGPVPEEPLERLEWQQRASAIGAYRELYGWDDEAEPCGPEPSGNSPEAREAWHAARSAVTQIEPDALRDVADGTLLRMREQYRAEYEWAPPVPGRRGRRGARSGDPGRGGRRDRRSRVGGRRPRRRHRGGGAARPPGRVGARTAGVLPAPRGGRRRPAR